MCLKSFDRMFRASRLSTYINSLSSQHIEGTVKMAITTLICVSCLLLLHTSSQAQSNWGNSPYSLLGVGESMPDGNIRTLGMGGLGLSSGSALFGNTNNPALINSNKQTMFDASYMVQRKFIKEGDLSQRDVGAGLFYLNFYFPISKRWTTGIGLKPVTNVSYSLSDQTPIEGTQRFATRSINGSGGISKVYWSNGVGIGRVFQIGLEAAYNFGPIERENLTNVGNISPYVTAEKSLTHYSHASFLLGASFTDTLFNNTLLNVGAIYGFEQSLNSDQLSVIERRDFSNLPITTDTVFEGKEAITLPGGVGGGISIEKKYHYLIGFDFKFQNWSILNYGRNQTPLIDAYSMHVGAEWTPDFLSVSNYLKRITWRAGASFRQTPWKIDGMLVQEASVTAGFSLPAGRFSYFNFAFIYGERGFNEPNVLSEEFYRFILGISINDRWFVKRKIH